ncbi:CatB-related O-acetyltransferase [Campylobacter peloridis]|uniref:CatB-related O-acetyltransferase n=1 Tax=Campylobacter peloridis TaxID=488546 RepID=A0A5C7DWC6_9BACT|nr:CatB-related O-acetyltransferase [Campylobacter peloridis]TXE81328.1 CatB-related O-acetyltransferase [Campylobacter peloridis]
MEYCKIKINKNIENLLNQNNIFFTKIKKRKIFKRYFIYVSQELLRGGEYIEEYCRFSTHLHKIGSFSYTGSILPSYTKVGRYCSIASEVEMFAYQHPLNRISTANFTYEKNHLFINKASIDKIGRCFPVQDYNPSSSIEKLIIENDVWIGKNALLKQGITLGNGCVVGQRAIVTKDVPPYAIVAGSPAKIIRYRFDEKTIERLLKIKWWNYHFADFHDINLNLDINKYLDILENKIANNKIQKFISKKIYLKELLKQSIF